MNARGVTVFIRRMRGVFHASTIQAEAIDPSATIAARRCAAKHYGVDEAIIDLTPSGEHTVIAFVREEPDRTLLGIAIACLVSTAALAWGVWYLVGGAS